MTGSLNVTFTDQPLIAVAPLLVTVTFTWYELPDKLVGVAVQVCAAKALPKGNINIIADIMNNLDRLKLNIRISNPFFKNLCCCFDIAQSHLFKIKPGADFLLPLGS